MPALFVFSNYRQLRSLSCVRTGLQVLLKLLWKVLLAYRGCVVFMRISISYPARQQSQTSLSSQSFNRLYKEPDFTDLRNNLIAVTLFLKAVQWLLSRF